MNKRLSKADTILFLGAVRRAFSRSDVYKAAKARYKIEHFDPKRPRCKNWMWCAKCGEVIPEWTTDLDHIIPVTPVDKFTYELTPSEIFERIWDCGENNLQILCTPCHNSKSKAEKEAKSIFRKKNKK